MADNSNIVRNGFATEESAEAQAQLTPEEAKEQLKKLLDESPSRRRMRFTPDYTLTKEYEELSKVDTSSMSEKEKEEHSSKLVYLKKYGLYTEEQMQRDIDYTLNSPLSESFRMREECIAEIEELERKIDSFDISEIQVKVNALTEDYKKRMKGLSSANKAILQAEYNRAVDEVEHKLITIPKNALKVKRVEAIERYKVADNRIKLYIACNKSLIEKQLERAKEAEITENLLQLAEYIGG